MALCSVAGHLFEVDDKLLSVCRSFDPFVVDRSVGAEPLFTLDSSVVDVVGAESVPLFQFRLGTAPCRLSLLTDGSTALSVDYGGREWSVVVPVSENRFRSNLSAFCQLPPVQLISFLILFAYQLAVLPHRTLVLHSSAVELDGRAVLFLGESGTGKSTQTQLWCSNFSSARLLNDDAPVVRVDNDAVNVYGSPWSGKTPCYNNRMCRVEAFVRVVRDSSDSIERLGALDSLAALLPSALPTIQKREEHLDQLCGLLSDIIARSPLYTLRCLPDNRAAQIAYDTIFAFLG